MEAVLLPICSIFFSLLLCVAFFSKKRIKLIENNLYGIMLITILFDGIFVSLAQGVTIFNGINTSLLFLNIINKLDFFSLIIFSSCIFLYTLLISNKNIYKYINKYVAVIGTIDLLFYIFILFSEINLINDGVHYSISGLAVILTFILCGFYIVSSIIVTLLNIKNITKRHIPILSIVAIAIFLFFLFQMNPYLIVISITLTFINYLMYFTIQNPDVKMIKALDMAKLQAEKANAAKTEFLSSMSHEIRTPLNAIVGFSDCILESETLAEAKDNAADIVNGILDISKIEAGKIEIVNTRYNAHNTYLELAKLISPKMLEKGLDFTYNIAEDLPNTLLGDHANIKKIITNLLSNACKYTDRGFVHYEVNCVNSGDVCKLIISVEDSGRGIKKESVDKMFTKFQRLDEDKNTTIEGTGLGLAITKQLTELMGGRIIVHTVYGQGSKFTVVINQKIDNTVVTETKKIKTTLDLTDVKLLIVDDNQLNLKVAKKMFEKFNANCITTCESGFDCIDKIKSGEEYDIILLDDMMPKKSGVETLAELKVLPDFKTPVISLTANAISGMREKYLSEGFNDYLAKPIDKNEFIRVCNEILGRTNTEEFEVISPAVETSRDEIIVPEDRSSDIIPVEENIEEILGDKLDIGRDKIIVDDKLKSEAEEVELLDDFVSDEIIIPDLEPVVDIDITSSSVSYDRNYLESNGIDVNHALELLGDMEMYNMTINDFMTEIDDKWSRINTYKENEDMENYAIDVHSLKSDCKYLGFMKLADISYQHELKSKENDVEFILNHFSELEEEYYKMYDIAKKYVEHNKVEE